jgi:hypothetical protein
MNTDLSADHHAEVRRAALRGDVGTQEHISGQTAGQHQRWDSPAMMQHPMLLRPVVSQTLAVAQDIEARGFLRGVGRLILFIIIALVVIGVVIGVLVGRVFNRRR